MTGCQQVARRKQWGRPNETADMVCVPRCVVVRPCVCANVILCMHISANYFVFAQYIKTYVCVCLCVCVCVCVCVCLCKCKNVIVYAHV